MRPLNCLDDPQAGCATSCSGVRQTHIPRSCLHACQGPGSHLETEGWLTCHQHILIFHVSCSEAMFSLPVFLTAFGVLSCDMREEEPRYSVTALSARRSQEPKNWWEKNTFVIHRGGLSTKRLFILSLTTSTSPQEQCLVKHLHQQAFHTSSGSFSQGFSNFAVSQHL